MSLQALIFIAGPTHSLIGADKNTAVISEQECGCARQADSRRMKVRVHVRKSVVWHAEDRVEPAAEERPGGAAVRGSRTAQIAAEVDRVARCIPRVHQNHLVV